MLEVKLARVPLEALGLIACGFVQQVSPLGGESIDEVPRSALVVILDLRTRSFEIAVVIQELEPPQNLLAAAFGERNDLVGTEKSLPMNMPEDVEIPWGELERTDASRAFETRQSFGTHPAIVSNILRRAFGAGQAAGFTA